MSLRAIAGSFKKSKPSGERGVSAAKVDPDMLKFVESVFKGISVGETGYLEANELMLTRVNESTLEVKCLLDTMPEDVQTIKLKSMGYDSIGELKETLQSYAKAVGMQILFARS